MLQDPPSDRHESEDLQIGLSARLAKYKGCFCHGKTAVVSVYTDTTVHLFEEANL